MSQGHKCKRIIYELLKNHYDKIVESEHNGDYLKAIETFNIISEDKLRALLNNYYDKERSRDQAWKSCKGALYEYAVFKYIMQIIIKNQLQNKIDVLINIDLNKYKNQIAIENWDIIYPDVDILLIDKKTQIINAIISCKTSLRERLTETAFWKRELEKTKKNQKFIVIFITTDKDSELKSDKNRYILHHVIDITFVTDPKKYRDLVKSYIKNYGTKDDFHQFVSRVRPIKEFEEFLRNYAKTMN